MKKKLLSKDSNIGICLKAAFKGVIESGKEIKTSDGLYLIDRHCCGIITLLALIVEKIESDGFLMAFAQGKNSLEEGIRNMYDMVDAYTLTPLTFFIYRPTNDIQTALFLRPVTAPFL